MGCGGPGGGEGFIERYTVYKVRSEDYADLRRQKGDGSFQALGSGAVAAKVFLGR